MVTTRWECGSCGRMNTYAGSVCRFCGVIDKDMSTCPCCGEAREERLVYISTKIEGRLEPFFKKWVCTTCADLPSLEHYTDDENRLLNKAEFKETRCNLCGKNKKSLFSKVPPGMEGALEQRAGKWVCKACIHVHLGTKDSRRKLTQTVQYRCAKCGQASLQNMLFKLAADRRGHDCELCFGSGTVGKIKTVKVFPWMSDEEVKKANKEPIKGTCEGCNGTGKCPSRSAQWFIYSIALTDLDERFRRELESYVGRLLCFRCSCPDIGFFEDYEPDPENPRYCSEPGCRIIINRWHFGNKCHAHEPRGRFCKKCNKRLYDNEPGDYCTEHVVRECPVSTCKRPLEEDEPGPYCVMHYDGEGKFDPSSVPQSIGRTIADKGPFSAENPIKLIIMKERGELLLKKVGNVYNRSTEDAKRHRKRKDELLRQRRWFVRQLTETLPRGIRPDDAGSYLADVRERIERLKTLPPRIDEAIEGRKRERIALVQKVVGTGASDPVREEIDGITRDIKGLNKDKQDVANRIKSSETLIERVVSLEIEIKDRVKEARICHDREVIAEARAKRFEAVSVDVGWYIRRIEARSEAEMEWFMAELAVKAEDIPRIRAARNEPNPVRRRELLKAILEENAVVHQRRQHKPHIGIILPKCDKCGKITADEFYRIEPKKEKPPKTPKPAYPTVTLPASVIKTKCTGRGFCPLHSLAKMYRRILKENLKAKAFSPDQKSANQEMTLKDEIKSTRKMLKLTLSEKERISISVYLERLLKRANTVVVERRLFCHDNCGSLLHLTAHEAVTVSDDLKNKKGAKPDQAAAKVNIKVLCKFCYENYDYVLDREAKEHMDEANKAAEEQRQRESDTLKTMSQRNIFIAAGIMLSPEQATDEKEKDDERRREERELEFLAKELEARVTGIPPKHEEKLYKRQIPYEYRLIWRRKKKHKD